MCELAFSSHYGEQNRVNDREGDDNTLVREEKY